MCGSKTVAGPPIRLALALILLLAAVLLCGTGVTPLLSPVGTPAAMAFGSASRAYLPIVGGLSGWPEPTRTPTGTPTSQPSLTVTGTAAATRTPVLAGTATPSASASPTTTDTPVGHRPSQPSELRAFHRSGQTFLTWREVTGLTGEAYHVYRHTAPITSATIGSARRLTTRWGPLSEGSSVFWSERTRTPPVTPNYVINDLGAPLADDSGLFVWTAKEEGAFYYAVATVHDGVENLLDFTPANSLATPLDEKPADPQPVLVWRATGGRGFVFTQYLDYETFNPTFDVPPDTGGQQYAFNYSVALPDAVACDGHDPATYPIYLYLSGWGGRYENPAETPYDWCAVQIYGDDPRQTWYYGYSGSFDYRHGGIPNAGPIVNFTEARLLRSVYDTLRGYGLAGHAADPNRVYVYGHSMGGSGALALGLRYPNVFAAAYASEPMTNYRAADGSDGATGWINDLDWKWGSVAANLPISNTGFYAAHLTTSDGTGVWDWQDHVAQLLLRRKDETALLALAHGAQDDVIGWTSQGKPVYQALFISRRPFSGAVVDEGHTWLGFAGSGPLVTYESWEPFHSWQVRRDETVPALTHASGSGTVPPSGATSFNLNLEWSASWHDFAGPPTDAPKVWAVALRTTDGIAQTVDVTPRRCRHFSVVPGAGYRWETRRLADDTLLASGLATADRDGLVTAVGVHVDGDGVRVSFYPAAAPVPTASPTPTPLSPAGRPWPDTTEGIHVFNDQISDLNNLTEAQVVFAATHYAGVQKVTRTDADRLRTVNPGLLILHYRLGLGLGYRAAEGNCQPTGEFLRIIEGDQWVQEWPGDAVVKPSWFFPWTGLPRVYLCDWGWYLMELSDPGYRAWWSGETLRQLAANDDDGLFADSLSVPNYLGAANYAPPLPDYDPAFETAWAGRIRDWIAFVKGQFQNRYALIANAGSWVTTRDPTDYSGADGVMIEGFGEWGPGERFDIGDWQLQMNRILSLARRGKVIIAQSYTDESIQDRLYLLSNYLLVKGARSYLNLDVDLDPEWWPEYEIPIGSYTHGIPADIGQLYDDTADVYRRDYTQGMVLVNPGDTRRTVLLDGTHYLAQPSGGGVIPPDGIPPGWRVDYLPVTRITLEPGHGAVLLTGRP